MRFYLFGPRVFGIRAGISFQPSDLRSRPPNASPASYVYVIKGDQNNVKIGVTKHPTSRLAQLRTGSSTKIDYAFLAPASGDPYAIERDAHAMLTRSRLNGEWFDVPPELAIAAVTGAAAKLGQSLTGNDKPPLNGTWSRAAWDGLYLFIVWITLSAAALWWVLSSLLPLLWP